jgi:hypothetical protein
MARSPKCLEDPVAPAACQVPRGRLWLLVVDCDERRIGTRAGLVPVSHLRVLVLGARKGAEDLGPPESMFAPAEVGVRGRGAVIFFGVVTFPDMVLGAVV